MQTRNCEGCGKSVRPGEWPWCPHGRGAYQTTNPNVHASLKTVYFEGPDGDVRIPGRADEPMHPKLAALGYQQRTCDSIADHRALEARTGLRSEVLNYEAGTGGAVRDCTPPPLPDLRRKSVEEILASPD